MAYFLLDLASCTTVHAASARRAQCRAGISSQKRIDIIAIFFGRIDIFKRYIGKFQIPFFMMNVTAKSIKNMST